MSATATAPEFPVIRAAYGSTIPGSTKGMLLVRDRFGHSTRQVDYADMEAWFSDHHPETFTADGDKRTFELGLATPVMLAAYFEHDKRSKPMPKGFEYGCLVDPALPAFSYYRNLADWVPGIAAGVIGVDGHVRIEKFPLQ